jgi:membrane protein
MASTLGFALIYALVPNRRVSFKHAIVGGMIAAVLFELAKRSFGWYLTTFPTYEAIYGALATIPIFLVWIYLSWLVVLFGAELTHCLGIFRDGESGSAVRRLELVDAVRVLSLLGEAQTRGEAMSAADMVIADRRWSEHHLEDLLNDLLELHYVHRTDTGAWVLAKGLEQIELGELVRSPRFRLPLAGGADWPQDERLAEVLEQADAELAEQLRLSLAEVANPRATPD